MIVSTARIGAQIASLKIKVAESLKSLSHVSMSRGTKESRDYMVRHREKRRAAGRVLVTTDLPAELVEAIDERKVMNGVRGRTPIIEEALRFYIENAPRA